MLTESLEQALAQQLAEDVAFDLGAEATLDDGSRNLSRTEAIDPHGPLHLAQPRLEAGLDPLGGDAHRQPTSERSGLFQ